MSRDDRRVPVSRQVLPTETRLLHRALLEHYLDTGDIPASEVLAHATQISEQSFPKRLKELANAGYLTFDGTGHLTCLFPFSATPTPYSLVIDGQRRYAMCAIDSLGVSAMLGKPLAIESACAVCGTPIRIDVRPGNITLIDPSATRIVAGSHESHPGERACCSLTSFVCSSTHAIERTHPDVQSQILKPANALRHAEALFSGLLTADSLPASFLPCP